MSREQTVRPLNIGDTVPDISINNVYNYPASTIRLSDLKGKLVILDFWSTWCGACIEAFPKMHQLQKEFGDQLQVVLVDTYAGDSIQRVRTFFEKRKARTGQEVTLPYSLLQTSLAEYFPFTLIPHYVWIDKAGKFLGTTTQNEINTKNIQETVAGHSFLAHQKKDNLLFNKEKPLFIDGNGGGVTTFLYRTIITPKIEGLGNATGIQRDNNGSIVRFYMLNNSLLFLLRNAWPEELNVDANRIIVEGIKSANLLNDREPSNTLYCYDLNIPPSSAKALQKIIRQDVERYFNLTVSATYRTKKCLVLRGGAEFNRFVTKGERPDMDIAESSIKKFIQNKPVKVFVDFINNLPHLNNVPVIDNINLSANIDVTLPYDIYELNTSEVIDYLKKTGIEVSRESRKIKCSIITDTSSSTYLINQN
jgi:thiol-disulfide isomerase/thioredoxin